VLAPLGEPNRAPRGAGVDHRRIPHVRDLRRKSRPRDMANLRIIRHASPDRLSARNNAEFGGFFLFPGRLLSNCSENDFATAAHVCRHGVNIPGLLPWRGARHGVCGESALSSTVEMEIWRRPMTW